jgi:hypothetical protein
MFRLIEQWRLILLSSLAWALALMPVVLLCPNAFAAAPKGSLDQNVVVANDGAIWAGSVETFAAGSKGNRAPEFLNVLKDYTSQRFDGLAINPLTGELFITESLEPAIAEFAPNANATKVPLSFPEVIIFGSETGLLFPLGIAFDTAAHPTVDTTGQVYVANNCSLLNPKKRAECLSLGCTSNPDEVDGSITVYNGYASGNVPPNLTIEGCNTFLGSPVGIFVDEATVDVCIGTADNAADLCDPSSGNSTVPVRTRRIWVVNTTITSSDAGFVSLVTVYAPELAEALGVSNCFSSAVTGKPICNELPLAGFFSTSIAGAASAPQDIAVNASETTAYITDAYMGQLKLFNLNADASCLETDSLGNCTIAISPFISASFRSAILGRHTFLSGPQGVSAVSTPTGDEVFVTNFRANSLVEFGPDALSVGGDVAPLALIKGLRTGLNQPLGVAVSPPPLIP